MNGSYTTGPGSSATLPFHCLTLLTGQWHWPVSFAEPVQLASCASHLEKYMQVMKEPL